MNILNFFKKSRKESIELLEFFYCISDVQSYLVTDYGKSKNILIVNFLNLLEWSSSWYFSQVKNYCQSLTDYVFWQSRNFYLESLRKFVAGELNASEFVDRVLYPILSNKREADDLKREFYRQVNLDLDSKSFEFSKILLALILPLEGFDEEPEESFFTEEELREGVKLALKEMEKYFKYYKQFYQKLKSKTKSKII